METEKERQRGNTTVGTRITQKMKRDIEEKVLATDEHLNTADYVRDLIRKDLERRAVPLEVQA